jgi:hypothetical protein
VFLTLPFLLSCFKIIVRVQNMGLSGKVAKISDWQYIGSLLQSYLRELSELENITLTPSGEYE